MSRRATAAVRVAWADALAILGATAALLPLVGRPIASRRSAPARRLTVVPAGDEPARASER